MATCQGSKSRRNEDERQIFVSSHFTLQWTREISLLFIDGVFGDNLPRPLSFYLSRYEGYLDEVKRLTFEVQPSVSADLAKTTTPKDSYIPTLAKDTSQVSDLPDAN